MLSEVEASLIFRRRQHKTQSEILRLRVAPLGMTKQRGRSLFRRQSRRFQKARPAVTAGRLAASAFKDVA